MARVDIAGVNEGAQRTKTERKRKKTNLEKEYEANREGKKTKRGEEGKDNLDNALAVAVSQPHCAQ